MTDTAWEYQSRSATAVDEMAVLAQAGEQGWELIDFGPFRLHFRRRRDLAVPARWEYARRNALFGDRLRQQMREQGWQPVGRWAIFHYFKRRRSQ